MKKHKLLFIAFMSFFFSVNSQILFSEYSEGSSYNKYLEIYNYTNEPVSLYPQFVLTSCTNGCIDGNNFYINEFPEGASIAPGDVYVVAATQADAEILIEADYTFQYCCGNGDDAYALMLAGLEGDVFDSSNALDIIGHEDTWQENIGWDVAGLEQGTKNHTLVRKSSVLEHNAGNWSLSAGTNADNSEWIVLEMDDWSNLGFHNYDGNNSTGVFGCTDSSALNFNPNATVDDGSCQYMPITGCYWCQFAANYFDFSANSTMANMTIALVDSPELIIGDTIGAFYVNDDGFMSCGGSVVFNGETMAMAAWGDDISTSMIDGFQVGDSFIFLILREGVVYETEFTLNTTSPFTDIYSDNAFAQVTEISIANEFIEECILPLEIGDDCSDEFFNISEDGFFSKPDFMIVDLFGRNVPCSSEGIQIRQYEDGTVEKVYFLNH